MVLATILYDTITDHRIKESWHNIPVIMAGGLGVIIEAIKAKENEQKDTE